MVIYCIFLLILRLTAGTRQCSVEDAAKTHETLDAPSPTDTYIVNIIMEYHDLLQGPNYIGNIHCPEHRCFCSCERLRLFH